MKGAMEKSIKRKFGRVILWTDSECVLKQIVDRTSKQKPFVANRLSKIRKLSRAEQWRHVDSKQNPADMCSRGIQAHEREKWRFYLEGPEFLRRGEEQWPKTPTWDQANIAAMGTDEAEEESNGDEAEEMRGAKWWLEVVAREESWEGKLRLIVILKKAGERWRMSLERKSRARTKAIEEEEKVKKRDFDDAEVVLIKAIQRSCFAKEISAALRKWIRAPEQREEVRVKDSRVAQHNPFWMGKE